MWAAFAGDADVAAVLLGGNALRSLRDQMGVTAHGIALANGHEELARLLAVEA